jgi:phospholipid/cholesterol/gamma-HCH transport system substrate-binding protein
MKKEQAIALRAGLFVIFMLVATAIVIFVLGTERGYFKKVFTVYTSFSNVLGLQPGAPVRLSGVTVGKVVNVDIPQDPAKTNINVVLQIERKVQSRIRTDSIASIKSLSYVTGDYYVEVSMGGSNKTMLKEGDYIQGIDPPDYSRAFESGINIVDSIHKNLKKIEDVKLLETLGDSAKSLNTIIEEIKNGKGILHSLVYEPEGKNLIDNISKTSENLKKEVDKITNQIRAGNGLLHALLYDEEKRKILDNMAQATEDLKTVTGKIAEGEGSIGAIINDPVLYDNLIQLLGGANRSFILRTLIRRSINKDASEKVE